MDKQQEQVQKEQSDAMEQETGKRKICPVQVSKQIKYKNKWQCKHCGEVFDIKDAKIITRNYAGIQLSDHACPKCKSKNLYYMYN